MITLGDKLKELRLKKGLTQAEVAEAIGVTSQAYSRWETNQRQPAYDLLADLLYLLGNPTFQIKDKVVTIGGETVNPSRKYLEIPSYDEVLNQYMSLMEMTDSLTTIEDIQSFAKTNPEIEVKSIKQLNSEDSGTNPLLEVEYCYQNLTLEVLVENGQVKYNLDMSLHDDREPNQRTIYSQGQFILPDIYSMFEQAIDIMHETAGVYTLNPNYNPHHDSGIIPKELEEITTEMMKEKKVQDDLNQFLDSFGELRNLNQLYKKMKQLNDAANELKRDSELKTAINELNALMNKIK